MIPFLFESTETQFTSHGLGPLSDATVCHVTEVLNGQYELYMSYPFSGIHADDLAERKFILASPNDDDDPQPFRIYKISPQSDGEKYIINAQHLSYDLSGYPVAPFSATGVTPSLTGLVANSMVTNPFTVWTDISNTETQYTQSVPMSFRACLGGTDGSILARFRGEYKWDKYIVRLYAHRGSDNGVSIRYGKNLESFKNERTTEASYTGCLAYWKDSDGNLVTGSIQHVEDYQNFPTEKIFMLDASSDFDEQPEATDLDTRAAEYIVDNALGVPFGDTITVSFVALWQTEEYKNIAVLEHVALGDTVHVLYRDYNVAMEVIETIYDSIGERYTSIKLGTKKASFGSTIKQVAQSGVQQSIDEATSMMQEAIEHAGDVLSGGTGGHIYINRNADGEPNEIYILENDTREDSQHQLRMNYAGIAFTADYGNTWNSAWLLDSTFYADFITAGTFNGNLIQAGSILTSALEVAVQTVVEGIKMNFSFLNDGLHIAEKDSNGNIVASYQTLVSNVGLRVIETSTNNAVLVAEEDTVTANNLTANQYLRVKADNVASRFQQFYSTAHQEYEFGMFWEIV